MDSGPTKVKFVQQVSSADTPTEVATPSQMTRLRAMTSDLSAERILSTAPRIDFDGKSVPSLGGVALQSKLGQGGMGAVYLGTDLRTKMLVAVKVLPLQMEAESQAIGRFIREASLASKVKSDHLVAVSAVNQEGGLYYFVMEFIDGKSAGSYLRELKEDGAQMPEPVALDICIAACRGLAVAHEAGIIHRDIKPDNILIPKDEAGNLEFVSAKLADLGLARNIETDQSMTETQVALGTPGYMAPEQCKDAKKADKCCDTFSMGACLYALLAGRPPFVASSAFETILATLTRPHQPVTKHRPDISATTSELIERCLSKEPRIRYETASKLLDALLVCRDTSTNAVTLTIPGARGRPPAFDHEQPAMQTQIKANPAKPSFASPTIQRPGPGQAAAFKQPKKSASVLPLVGGVALIALAVGMTWGKWQSNPVEDEQQAANTAPALTPTPPSLNPQPAPRLQPAQPAPVINGDIPIQPPRDMHVRRKPSDEVPLDRKPDVEAPPAEQRPDAEELTRQQLREELRKTRMQDARNAIAAAQRLAQDARTTAAQAQEASAEATKLNTQLEQARESERQIGQRFAEGRKKIEKMQTELEKAPRPPPRGGRGGRPPPPPEALTRMEEEMNEMQEKHRAVRDKLRSIEDAQRLAAEKDARLKREAEKAQANAATAAKLAAEAAKEFPELLEKE
jgi:serine/threonine protein kinase